MKMTLVVIWSAIEISLASLIAEIIKSQYENSSSFETCSLIIRSFKVS